MWNLLEGRLHGAPPLLEQWWTAGRRNSNSVYSVVQHITMKTIAGTKASSTLVETLQACLDDGANISTGMCLMSAVVNNSLVYVSVGTFDRPCNSKLK